MDAAQATQSTASTPHVAVVTSLGMGHFIPVVELAKQLVLGGDLSVTLLVPTVGTQPQAQREILSSLPRGINYVPLPISSDGHESSIASKVWLAIPRSLSSIRETLSSLLQTTWLVAVVVDIFGTEVFDVAAELSIPAYLHCSCSATFLCWVLHLPRLDESVSCEYRDLPEPLKLPGCVALHGRDFPDPVQQRHSDVYKLCLGQAKRFGLARGILVNSFVGLETGPIKALQNSAPPVYPVGPVVRTRSERGAEDSDSLRWLDEQPFNSVVFVSFGSGGTVSYDQLRELALGLELSGHRFLWVVRSPDESPKAAYLSVHSRDDPFHFLPQGFLERTKGQGLVVDSWAPQVEILGHRSTAGFLTHCGWNSILESVVHGVPFIAWPLFAEQKMNALLLTEDLKVALRPKANDKGLVEREEIAMLVKSLMEADEGKGIRNRMMGLNNAAGRALCQDGPSTKSLAQLVRRWKNEKTM